MARLFPLRSETPAREGAPRIVDLEDEDADAVFSALSSTTARRIYTRLSNEPGTPSDVAEAIDSSIQNVRYHLENLEEAGLVEVVDTWYSSRGNEMSVYATTDGPLIVTSDETRASQLKDAISRFIGGVTVLAGASLLVQVAVERFFSPNAGSTLFGGGRGNGGEAGGDDGGDGAAGDDVADGDSADVGDRTQDEAEGGGGVDGADGADGADGDVQAEQEAEDDVSGTEDVDTHQETGDGSSDGGTTGDGATEPPDGATETGDTVTTAADGAVETSDAFVSTIPPGVLFFLGGMVVLSIVTLWWYRSSR